MSKTLHQPDEDRFHAIRSEDVQWKPFAAFPPEARLAILVGDPTKPGPYVIRVKLPAGIKLMPHRHPEDRIYTVISGVFYIGLGDVFDESKLNAFAPGKRRGPSGRPAAFPLGQIRANTSRRSARSVRSACPMSRWATTREIAEREPATMSALLKRLGIELPIVQAPMAGTSTPAMAAAVLRCRRSGLYRHRRRERRGCARGDRKRQAPYRQAVQRQCVRA